MENKEKIIGYIGLSAVILAAGLISYKIKGEISGKGARGKQAGQVLGIQIDARGPVPAGGQNSEKTELEINNDQLKKVRAKSYIIFNLKTGANIAELNAEEELPVASLTKLMTAYIAYKELNMQSGAEIRPEKYWGALPSLKFAPNDKILVQDLFDSMLIGSANDAAFALAQAFEDATGKNFVAEMNKEAENLGMQNTLFSNPAGFDSGQNFSSARDLKILIQEVFNLPAFKNLARRTSHSFKSLNGRGYYISATNKLLSKYPDLLAVKTGYTKKALGSMATVIETPEGETAVIVLDSPSRESDTLIIRKALLNGQ